MFVCGSRLLVHNLDARLLRCCLSTVTPPGFPGDLLHSSRDELSLVIFAGYLFV